MSGKKDIEQFKCIVNLFEIGRFYRTFADLSLGLELLIDWLLFDVNIALCRLFLWRWEFFIFYKIQSFQQRFLVTQIN